MNKAMFRRWIAVILVCFLFLGSVGVAVSAPHGETARPSVSGRLQVIGGQLCNASGKAVQLHGVSTHGLTWFPDFVNGDLFARISEDWDCNLVRLAMYAEQYCGGAREESLSLVRKGIDLAIASDMYVLVDWHILNDSNPNENLEAAADFFDTIASEYANHPNLLFEICNEPNGSTGWSDIMDYSEHIIPVIRRHSPDSVILVGTPDYDRILGDCLLRPLSFHNVMYVLHFYAASHHDGLLEELKAAVNAGLPVFVSECGLSEASGDDTLDFGSAAEWFTYLNEKQISYALWGFSDKDESSAFFKTGFSPDQTPEDGDLTLAGTWIRELLRGQDPNTVPAPGQVVEKDTLARIRTGITESLGSRGYEAIRAWTTLAAVAGGILLTALLVGLLLLRPGRRKRRTYDDIVRTNRKEGSPGSLNPFAGAVLILAVFLTLLYLGWRIIFSVPVGSGVFAVAGNILLLAVEIFGLIESMVLYRNLIGLRKHPLPVIPEADYPEVDVLIATYNEPTELLRRTVNGCKHMKYPDPSKVHIWICDDNRRPEMRRLAEEMGVGYFDRPDNTGAKAGNLNHAMSLTSAPYIVTFDADMIPQSGFLLKTIPYFVDVENREKDRPEGERLSLGLLQTPQCFYDPDVFQHALYSEKRAPNEQDFFYRTIEPAKTSTNSVIYGGSNTVLSRKALEDIGGFYTGSITEDFATGLLIESKGYVSLALSEPLASGQTPNTYKEHIKQRTRWGRGVILTAKKLKLLRRKELTLSQKISYWSSVVYWWSPVKNLIYMLSPLLYAVFAVPVFHCNWLELLVFWLPMFLLQDLSLRLYSKNAISTKWSGIYETSVMPHLLIPIIKETLGFSLSQFKVTDKSGRKTQEKRDIRSMIPFLIMILLSFLGILRLITIFDPTQTVSLLILLFWIIRNLYFLVMSVFLVDGRDSDGEPVKVLDAEPVTVRSEGSSYEGITTLMTEHNMTVFLDEGDSLTIGSPVDIRFNRDGVLIELMGCVTGIRESKHSYARTHTLEILDYGSSRMEYWQILYDRVPTLPQSLHRDFGVIRHLWQNIAYRIARTTK